MQFNFNVLFDVETNISSRRGKRDFTATDRDGSSLETEKDLKDERMERAFVLLLFSLSLFFSIQV